MGRGAARRAGVQTEVLLSLAVVMLTATGILGAVLVRTHEAHVGQLRGLAGRSLLGLARAQPSTGVEEPVGLRWWRVGPDGSAAPHGGHADPLDTGSAALAAEARERVASLLRAGPAWEPIRFATPLPDSSDVAVARLPAAVSRGLLFGLLLGDALVFTGLGAYLLRRRVVVPLQHLARAARGVADGGLEARVPIEGVGETAEVAAAFNEMAEGLESRTHALEKAVGDLRQSNRSLREARAGLDRAERLAAVGRLAAGVAHEVGNPMGAVLAFLDLARRDPELPANAREYIGRASREGERVRTILRQLLDFSRPPRFARRPVDLSAVCEETAQLVRAQRRFSAIAIEIEERGEAPPALADRGAVAQILLNLLLNAASALEGAGPEPRIRIGIRPVAGAVREGEDRAAAAHRTRFDAVECCVEDNGSGVAEEHRERIFDPFFTTKPVGEGTGLGLSNALRFAQELGGSLDLGQPRDAGGAAFVLTLPAAVDDATTGAARAGD